MTLLQALSELGTDDTIAVGVGDQFGPFPDRMTVAEWRDLIAELGWDGPGWRVEYRSEGNRLLDEQGIPALEVDAA